MSAVRARSTRSRSVAASNRLARVGAVFQVRLIRNARCHALYRRCHLHLCVPRKGRASLAARSKPVATSAAPPVAHAADSRPAPPPRPPEEIARASLPSVVLIVVNDAHSQPLAMGSGFLLKDGIIATNYHVIEGGSSAIAKTSDSDKPINIEGVLASDPEPRPCDSKDRGSPRLSSGDGDREDRRDRTTRIRDWKSQRPPGNVF